MLVMASKSCAPRSLESLTVAASRLGIATSSTIKVPVVNKISDGPIHLVIDSTGLKMLGDGEWALRPGRNP